MFLSRGALSRRLSIVGNSGSGKSTLAGRLASLTSQPVLDLDGVHWLEPGRKQDEAVAREAVASAAAAPCWIIEGVYGWLTEVALPRATALIWIDLAWADCRKALLDRGLRRGMTEGDQAALLVWAEAYDMRSTPSSAAGHARIFDAFRGEKVRLRTRAETETLLGTFTAACGI